MINALFVNKRFNTYADTFLMLGLARIAAYALGQTRQKTEMQLMDEGTRYRIQFKKPVAMEAIANLPYAETFPPVCGQKTDQSKLRLRQHLLKPWNIQKSAGYIGNTCFRIEVRRSGEKMRRLPLTPKPKMG